MARKFFFILFLLFIMLLIDFYFYQAVRALTKDLSEEWKKGIRVAFWGLSAIAILAFLYYHFAPVSWYVKNLRMFIVTGLFVIYFSKLFTVLFLMADDVRRGIKLVASKISGSDSAPPGGEGISRSDFLMKAGLIAAAVPFTAMSYGIISGAHDYRIIRQRIALKNLPSSFHGLTIAQVSDIHSGSFYNRTAVKGGVEMLLREKPDVVFFTGDLVNDRASEMKEWLSVFKEVSAPLGAYSVLGNHDYGNYVDWESVAAQRKNLHQLLEIQKEMGWQLLNNENTLLRQNGDAIAIVGVENWGKSDWQPKYGNLDEAVKGVEDIPVKLLLSHDPSHWEAQILGHSQHFDITFSGHTHGMQFGIEAGPVKWSPSQYFYPQWAGMYEKEGRRLYVNRGYGYIGFPGRIGMPPEITIFELTKA